MQQILGIIQQLLNAFIPLLVTLGVVYFVWGVVQYVIGDSEEAKKTGTQRIIYSIIGLAIIISLWGIVGIIGNTFGLKQATLSGPQNSTCTMGGTFRGLANYVTCIINKSVIPLIFALALVTFVYGVVKFFIIDADEEAKRSQGKQFMIWGIVALVVMLGVWGLVNVLAGTFGVSVINLPYTKE